MGLMDKIEEIAKRLAAERDQDWDSMDDELKDTYRRAAERRLENGKES